MPLAIGASEISRPHQNHLPIFYNPSGNTKRSGLARGTADGPLCSPCFRLNVYCVAASPGLWPRLMLPPSPRGILCADFCNDSQICPQNKRSNRKIRIQKKKRKSSHESKFHVAPSGVEINFSLQQIKEILPIALHIFPSSCIMILVHAFLWASGPFRQEADLWNVRSRTIWVRFSSPKMSC